jgi:hypothetical protein
MALVSPGPFWYFMQKNVRAMSLRRAIALGFLSAMVLGLPGCVSTTLSTQGKTATVSGLLGTHTLALNTHPLLVVNSGLGIFSRPGEFTMGWLKESRVYLAGAGEDCRIIVLPESASQFQELLKVLEINGKSISQVCIINP